MLLKSQKAVDRTMAINWVDWYIENDLEAITALLQVFVSILGYEYKVNLLKDRAYIKRKLIIIVKSLILLYDENQPYILNDKSQELFKEKYMNTLKKIIIIGRKNIIFDDFFLGTINNFLELLYKSCIENFQHLAILTALSIYTPLTRIQYNLIKINSSNLIKISTKMDYLYKSIISLGMSTVNADDIIHLYVSSIKKWFYYDKYGLTYCNESNMKFILEAAKYSVRSVKTSAIITLRNFYKMSQKLDDFNKCPLFNFTKTYQKKIINLCFRRGSRLRSFGIEIVKFAYIMFSNVFKQDQLNLVFKLVFDNIQHVARNAGSFLWTYIKNEYNEYCIQYLVILILDYKRKKYNVNLLVDALYNEITKEILIKILNLFFDMLEPSYGIQDFLPNTIILGKNIELTENDKIILFETLLDILLNFIRLTATVECARYIKKKKEFTDYELLDMKLKMNLITEILCDKICLIIEKTFEINENCLIMALEIPQHFNYFLYLDKETLIIDLVIVLSQILYEKRNENISEVCLKTINVLRESVIYDAFVSVRMLDDDVNIFKEHI